MKTLVNVARYHLVDRITYVALPWAILAFSFLINLAIAVVDRTRHDSNPRGWRNGDGERDRRIHGCGKR